MKDLLVKFNPDVVILPESKVRTVDFHVVKSVWSSRIVWVDTFIGLWFFEWYPYNVERGLYHSG